jgi:hypothetical protein
MFLLFHRKFHSVQLMRMYMLMLVELQFVRILSVVVVVRQRS